MITSTYNQSIYPTSYGVKKEQQDTTAIALPSYFISKSSPTMGENEYKKAIIDLAEQDAVEGTPAFKSSGYYALRKNFISVVSPERESIINDSINALQVKKTEKSVPTLEELMLCLLGNVQNDSTNSKLEYAEFSDSNGNLIAMYGQNGWIMIGTPEEDARHASFNSVYISAYRNALGKQSAQDTNNAYKQILDTSV